MTSLDTTGEMFSLVLFIVLTLHLGWVPTFRLFHTYLLDFKMNPHSESYHSKQCSISCNLYLINSHHNFIALRIFD